MWSRNGRPDLVELQTGPEPTAPRLEFRVPSADWFEAWVRTYNLFSQANEQLNAALAAIGSGQAPSYRGAFDRTCELVLELDRAATAIRGHCMKLLEFAKDRPAALEFLRGLTTEKLMELAVTFANECAAEPVKGGDSNSNGNSGGPTDGGPH